jgi:hypothetical protein
MKVENMKKRKPIKTANQIARTYRHGRATEIIVGDDSRCLTAVSCGYRKYTTGQYVSNAYRNNFGWKNTYYQHAKCKVMVNIDNFY